MSKEYVLERVQRIPRPLDEVFEFFADAGNLEAITPPWLNFKILSKLPIEMREGALIEYKLRLFGVPIFWRTLIEKWSPTDSFVDRQLVGPYKLWHHTHTFVADGNETVMTDRVRYQIPFGPIGTLAHVVMVQGLLKRIFDYRYETIEKLLCQGTNPKSTAAKSVSPSPVATAR